MKAITYSKYGSPDVLQLQEVEKPVPNDNELLVRIYATTVNFGDLMARNFKNVSPAEFNMPMPLLLPARMSFGWNSPKNPILGSEFSGEIEAVGKDVARFKKGDAVFGYLGQDMGAYAEYVCISAEATVAIKPVNMTFEEAAAVPYGALMALNILKKANIKPGQKVCVIGASGSIGSAAVQMAKSQYGAQVTGVCSTRRIDYVKSLGVDEVIDYTQTDFTQNGETYDLILDILGKSTFSRCKNSLSEHGIYLLASFKSKQLFQMLSTSIRGNKKVVCALVGDNADDLAEIKSLVEAGKIKTIIDKCFPLADTAEAHQYVENGHQRGKVVIVITHSQMHESML